MALTIEDPEVDRLAHELARTTGETVDVAVAAALKERLERETGRRSPSHLRDEVAHIQARIASLPVLDSRPDEEILGYDENGLPG